jgi:hypothetical protein
MFSLNAFLALEGLEAYVSALRDLGAYDLVLRGLRVYGSALRGLQVCGLALEVLGVHFLVLLQVLQFLARGVHGCFFFGSAPRAHLP